MLLSDKKVMRVFGNKPDYLRGKVYTRYRHGTWLNTHEHKLEEHDYSAPPTPTKTRSNSKPNTEIQFIGSVRDRYFLPMDAATIGTENGGGRTDLGGIIHTLPDERTERIWFTQSTKSDIKIASPIEDELKISKSIQASITDLSNRWTHGLKTKQEKLIAIEKKLKTDFSYALAFTYNGHLDPIMGFLLEVKAGHCEYFATAMALLARAQGIPTHVVGGYRVRQLSSMGNYYLVRERNAHSWVEAWLPNQGWVRYDPTPTTEVPLPEKESFSMAALGDYLIVLINTGLDHLTQLSFTQLAILVGVMACIWALIIIIRQVKAKRSKKLISSPQNFREGLASLEQLMAQTALFGLKKQPNEPLEVFAQRLINTSNTQLNFKKAGTIVNKYTEWRYGTHGEAAAIDDEINRWLTAQKGRQDKKKF